MGYLMERAAEPKKRSSSNGTTRARSAKPGRNPAPSKQQPWVVAIVDDEPDIVETLALLMKGHGLQPQTYTRGIEFLASVQKQPPHAVVLDLLMPSPNGFEILRQLRERGLGHIPVIVMTGSGKDAVRQAVESGAVSGFVKPFNPIELLDKLKNALES